MISEYLKTHRSKIGIFLAIWLIASGVAINLRLYTLIHHTSNTTEDQATLVVLNNIRKTVYAAVEKTNPTLSPIQLQQRAKMQFDIILHNDGAKIRQTIDQISRQMEESSPPTSNPFYLMEADSYYYYNLSENILKTGKLSPKIKGSKYFNPLMNAPHGYWEPLNLHPYIGVTIYKIVSWFHPGVSLMEGLSYTPLFLTALILLVFLIGCYTLECSPGIAFLGAIYLSCVPVFLRRSMFGWYKNDPTNILFLFLIPTVFFYGLKNIKDRRTATYVAVICSFLLSLYSLFWQGWVFLASIIAAASVLIILVNHFIHEKKDQSKSLLIYCSIIILGTFLGVSILFGPKDFFILFKEGWTALQDFLNPRLAPWPDLYIAVGELLSPTPAQWVEMLGGIFFIGIGTLGLLFQLFKMFQKPDEKIDFSIILLLIFWAIGIYLSMTAQRFQTLCLIPFAFLFPLGLQNIYNFIKRPIINSFPIIKGSAFAQFSIATIAIFTLSIFPFRMAQAKTPEVLNKIFNSTWDAALTKIDKETPPESIVNTWWPPGHFVKAIAHRRVTFDGATINKPQAYWLSNVFLTGDEKYGAGLLRMLNDSANDATDYLTGQGIPLSDAVTLIKKIAGLDEELAKKVLSKDLSEQQITELLSLTHAVPPPSYVLIYNEMIESSLQFSFVGKWDFKRIEMINQDPEARARVPGKHSKNYIPFLWQISGGPPRISDALMPIAQQKNIILFDNNIRVDTDNMTCEINSPKYGKGIPQSIVYSKNGQFIEKRLPKANLSFSVMLIEDGRSYKCILAEPSLARSLLMRLYYFGGNGLKIFEPFCAERDATGRTQILVYKINWQNMK